MSKHVLRCTIESAGDGWMVIWLGGNRLEATCHINTKGQMKILTGTVRNGPKKWRHCDIEITTADNENGEITLAA